MSLQRQLPDQRDLKDSRDSKVPQASQAIRAAMEIKVEMETRAGTEIGAARDRLATKVDKVRPHHALQESIATQTPTREKRIAPETSSLTGNFNL